MARLKLISIRCNETEDSTGADETYLRIRGREVWKANMNEGDEESLTHLGVHSFTKDLKLELREEDSGFFDDDDSLGTKSVKATDAGRGEKTLKFTGDGANYELRYEVFADDRPSRPRPRLRRNLHLLSLECHETEDTTGADEVYLRVGGRHVYGPKPINNGDAKAIGGEDGLIIPFDRSTEVQLWDSDSGFLDRDDLIDTHVVRASEVPEGEKRERLMGDGADYTLVYRVSNA